MYGDVEDRQLPEHESGRDVGDDGCQEGHREHRRSEVALDLLEDEHEPGQRRVERRRQAGTGAGCDQGAALTRRGGEPSTDHLSDGRAHLDGRSLATEREARADAHDAARELHREDAFPADRGEAVQDRLHVRYPASRRLGREPRNQPYGDATAGRGDENDDEESPRMVQVGCGDELGSQSLHQIEGGAKGDCEPGRR